MTFDPALSMLADPMIDNSLLQDLFYAQDGTVSFGKEMYYQGNLSERKLTFCELIVLKFKFGMDFFDHG